MKKHQRLIVYLSFLIGSLLVFIIPHQMPSRTLGTIVLGAIAFFDLAIFYYRRYEEPGYDPDSDDLGYKLEILAFGGLFYLLIYVAYSR